ncbi:velvet factor-domain-containing protein [Amylocystis lapponica]|nr:velvet factor-domain-containing protein [Amylocystis lapponica]
MDEEQHQFVHAQLPVHSQYDRDRLEYELTVRQEPKQARMCGVGGKADRRPIDPPPIIQLRVIDPAQHRPQSSDSRSSSPDNPGASLASQSFLQNPYYFMFASLAKPDEDVELHWLKDGKTRCTTGSVVSSLYHLKDAEAGGADAGFFVFPDLSVRTEGSYRLKLSLFEVVGSNVYHCKSIFSAPFYVYTAKKFPGMEESTPLSCSLADQGIKIRIRKDIRVRKRPMQPLDHPVPIPMPMPLGGPAPVPQGAYGPVPIPLPMDDEPESDDPRDRERDRARDYDRDRERDAREREQEEDSRRRSTRRDSGESVSHARRESMSERGPKRVRSDDAGALPDGPEPGSSASASNAPSWGVIDSTLNAQAPPPQQPQPQQPVSSVPQATAENHYIPAPAPAPAPTYEHRFPAAAPAPAPTAAVPPSGPAPGYHYDPHAHPGPPPAHHYPPPHHYSHPQQMHHAPPPAAYPHPSYPIAGPPAPGPPNVAPSWGYDPYSHHYSQMPPPHHAPPPRYDYTYPQGYYYDHHPPPPPAHHPYHSGYPPAPAPPSPQGVQYGEYAAPAQASSSAYRPPSGAAPAPSPEERSAPQNTAAPYTSGPPPQAPAHYYGAPPPAAQYAPQAPGASPGQARHGHYQLSTPPHHHQAQGYSAYPPPPGTAGASADGAWPPAFAQAPNPTPGAWSGGPPTMLDAYGGAYAGAQVARDPQSMGRIQLAPLRGTQVTPPPGAGAGSGHRGRVRSARGWGRKTR